MAYSLHIQIAVPMILFGLVAVGIWIWVSQRRRSSQIQIDYQEFLPAERVIRVDDFTINYVQLGHGPDLILVHGIGSQLYAWRFVYRKLSQSFRVTALDLPGFGKSSKLASQKYGLDEQADRLCAFLDKLKIEKVHLIGNSMGAGISLWFTKKYPQRVEKVIALSPAASSKLVPRFARKLEVLVQIMSSHINEPLIKLLWKRTLFHQILATRDGTKIYFAPYKNNPDAARVFIKATDAIGDRRLPMELSKITTPTLLVWAKQDRLIPREMVVELSKIIPGAEMVEIDQAGHQMMEDAPDQVTKLVTTFLTKNQEEA